MSYSVSSSNTYFTSSEHAPGAQDAYNGALIPNESGSWALSELTVDTSDPTSNMELDNATEPPTLRLRNVGAVGVWGAMKGDEFVTKTIGADAGHWIVSGDYTGPNSTLEV